MSAMENNDQVISGIGVSPGRAVGTVVRMPDPVPEPSSDARLEAGASPDEAAEQIAAAAQAVRERLEETARGASGTSKEVLETTAMMAADPSLVKAAQKLVRSGGVAPARAVWQAAGQVIDQLAAIGGYMGERTRDVADVRDRVVAELTGRPAPGVPDPGHPFVLLARDLAPADTATLDPARVVAIVTSEGGPTSHTAILARALGIPAVVGAEGSVDVADGTRVLVDGAKGSVTTDPSDEEVARAEALAAQVRTFDGRGRTSDGHEVPLLANIGAPESAQAAADLGAEGVGLFRTEFCFLDRKQAPTIEEQVTAYRQVLAAFPGKKVVVRTLDAGADKPLPFLTDATEPNPALGVRGYRTDLTSPGVLQRQLEAIALAEQQSEADVWVMAPMISTAEEAARFAAMCTEAGLKTPGVMVEVPSAALTADAILREVSFASLGTNDLTQYAMAADRQLGPLAPLNTPWQPAVLRLVRLSVEGAELEGNAKPVGVCGEAAADPALAVVLVGLGVTTLSMTARSLAAVAAVLKTVTLEQAQECAKLALTAPNAEEARNMVRAKLTVLDELGL